jgi:putative membrane-bound dehydrogenase-like protein
MSERALSGSTLPGRALLRALMLRAPSLLGLIAEPTGVAHGLRRVFVRATAWAAMACCLSCAAQADELPEMAARSPHDELASFQLTDPELIVELVAAEPNVISPVAVCWDADGAMYVAEMRDYPVGPAAGTIRRLTDRDGDGRYETATIFADKLNFPNGLLCTRDGLLVTAAPNLLFLRDNDGDGVADERRVAFTGFGEGNQQLRVNGLTWGLDNWIYGANGRSDGAIRQPNEPAEQAISIRTQDFRFRPDFSGFAPIFGQSQFGQTRDDWGNRFLSWNTIPVRQAVLDEIDVARNPHLARYAVTNLADPSDSGEVFPIAPRPQTFNRESTNHYNALAGLTIYRGDNLGPRYAGNAFVGESLSSLVHRRELVPEGPTFVSRRGDAGREFLAGGDPWFHPVNHTTGPDGALYIADFYRRWVEHPQFVAGAWRDKVAWQEGSAHGRIWRVRRRGDYTHRQPRLSKAATAQLVAHLADGNGWWRDTAQRLLVERADKSAVPLLASRTESADPLVAATAMWTLVGLDALDEKLLAAALRHPAAPVRVQALQIAPMFWAESPALRQACLALASDSDVRVQIRLARALGGLPGPDKLPALAQLSEQPDADGWLARAISAGAANAALPFAQELIARQSSWLIKPSQAQLEALEQLAEQFAASGQPTITDELLALVDDPAKVQLAPGQLAMLAGAAAAERHPSPATGAGQSGTTDDQKSRRAARLNPVLERVLSLALDRDAEPSYRVLAVRVLRDLGSAADVSQLVQLTTEPDDTADAAITAICRRADAVAVRGLLDGWGTYAPSRRRAISAAALESPLASREFVDALDRQIVRPAEIDPAVRTAFSKNRDPELAARAERIFAAAAPAARDEVLTKYRAALDLQADRAHGAVLFKAHCFSCHHMFGLGRQVGPDLSGIGGRPKETLLVDVLDPSRQVAPDYLSYTLLTGDGRALSGILVSDTVEAITLRRGEGADDTILKRDIEDLQAAGKSLMPEGLEQRLSVQDVADVLGFLILPDRRLLEQP